MADRLADQRLPFSKVKNMETKQYTTVDKSGWAERGAWDHEPDKVQWPDPNTGLPCLIVRGPSGALCGYVGVPDTHPWHRKEYGAPVGPCNAECTEDYHFGHRIDSSIEVHGGLTFSDACQHAEEEDRGICHLPGPGEPDNIWWFGFDCAHSGDTCPMHDSTRRFSSYGSSYKSIAYVKNQVTELARQLHAVAS